MMKKVITTVIISILVFSLTGCASFASIPGLNESAVPAEADYSTNLTDGTINFAGDVENAASEVSNFEKNGDAEPAESFSCTEDAVKKIHEIKEAGSEAMAHPDDYKLYEKDYIYFLKDEQPLSDYKQESVMVTLGGTAMLYLDDEYHVALFTWTQGGENEEMVEERTNRYSLEQYKDTKYYFGELFGDVDIHWWENGDEFSFSYPADTGVLPEDVIEYLEVVRYDF